MLQRVRIQGFKVIRKKVSNRYVSANAAGSKTRETSTLEPEKVIITTMQPPGNQIRHMVNSLAEIQQIRLIGTKNRRFNSGHFVIKPERL